MKEINLFKKILFTLLIVLGLGALVSCGKEKKDDESNEEVDPFKAQLSSVNYDINKEYFYDDYNDKSLADTKRQGVVTFDDKDIVFEAVTYEKLINILNSEGNYLIFFGGAWCHNTRATARFVNEYAKKYNVDTIYNFDFRLDGVSADSHIRVSDPTDTTKTKTAGEEYNYLYGELIKHYLTNVDDFIEYTSNSNNAVKYTNPHNDENDVKNANGLSIAAKIQVPFLFLYNKDNTIRNSYDFTTHSIVAQQAEDGKTYPVVYGFEEMIDYTIVDGKDKITYEDNSDISNEYPVWVDNFFKNFKDTNISEYSDEKFFKDQYNGKGVTSTQTKLIFSESEKVNIISINYRQLAWLLEQEGNSIILLGGSWCGNTQATITTINDYAVENNLYIYNFDTKLTGGKSLIDTTTTNIWDGGDVHIRDNNNPFVYLYAELLQKYLTNIVTLYDKTDGNASHNITYTDSNNNTVVLNKAQVPYLFSYNKNAKDTDGFSAPITAYLEQMLYLYKSVTYGNKTFDVAYVYESTNYNAYKTGIKNILDQYASITGISVKEITINRVEN